jgi:hypothetical protein
MMGSSVRVDVWQQDRLAAWQELVESCNGTALHLPATHRAEVSLRDMQLLVFEAERERIACALGMRQRRRLLGAVPLGGSTLLLPTSPALRDAARAQEVLDALIHHARGAGFERLQVQPQGSAGLQSHPLLGSHSQTSLVEFVLDLQRPADEILAAMHKTHRKNARRAEARGVQVREDSSLEGLLKLRAMQEVSAQRAAERQHGFAVRDESYFRKVHENVYAPGLGRVLFARREGEDVAALAFLSTARHALTVRSGSLPAGYETYAMYLLHVELIRDLQGRGVVQLNLGGVPVEAAEPGHPQWGLHEFKKGFGSHPVPRAGADVPLRGES